MNLSFRLRDAVKNAERVPFDKRGKRTRFEKSRDLAMATPMGVLNSLMMRMGMRVLMFMFVCLMPMPGRMFMSMRVCVDILVQVLMWMCMHMHMLMLMLTLVLMLLLMVVFLIVCAGMTVLMPFALVTALDVRTRVDVEFESLDVFPLGSIDVDMEITNLEFGKLPLQCRRFYTKIAKRADGHVATNA